MSKKLNHKDTMNNFVALPGELISSPSDRLTSFVISSPNHHINDESLKLYFYKGQNDKNKAVLDTIAGGSYGECTYEEIAVSWIKSLETTRLGALGSRTLEKYLCRASCIQPRCT